MPFDFDNPRERAIKPRTRGYVHRGIIAVVDGMAVTEHGEHVDPVKLAGRPHTAYTDAGEVWIVDDPVWLLSRLLDAYGDHPDFNYQTATSESAEDGPRMVKSRLTRFGFRCVHPKGSEEREACPYRRRVAMSLIWTVSDLSQNPGELITDFSHGSMLNLAMDIRNWCEEQNVPIPGSLPGIANALLRDSRFWPEARGRVPKATNENVRKWLPGVYAELRAKPLQSYTGVALDQNTAYHVAAQEVPTPDPTSLFARGYFNDIETQPIWAPRGTPNYEVTIKEPGIVYVQVSAHHAKTHEVRPPAVKNSGRYRVALWTNEIPMCEANGIHVEGIIAAWTSTAPDEGLPRYARFAQEQITEASAFRKRWLKPTLHALYGLMGTRPRHVKMGHHRGRSPKAMVILGNGHPFEVAQADLGVIQPPTVNVATLGVLQSEIRKRSLELARELSEAGVTILHIHADGIHVTGELPLMPPGWKIEPLTNVTYLNNVQYLSDEGDVLPGARMDDRIRIIEDTRARMAMAEHAPPYFRLRGGKTRPRRKWSFPETWKLRTVIDNTTPDDLPPLQWPDGSKRYYVDYPEDPRARSRHDHRGNAR